MKTRLVIRELAISFPGVGGTWKSAPGRGNSQYKDPNAGSWKTNLNYRGQYNWMGTCLEDWGEVGSDVRMIMRG